MPPIKVATEGGNEAVVAGRDEVKTGAVAATFNCLVLSDDAAIRQTLDEADTDRVDTVITTTNKDVASIMVYLLAREFDIPDIVSVVYNPEHMSLYHQVGANMMESPQRLIAECLYRATKRPSIVDYMCIDEHVEVFRIRVDKDAPITGMMIQETAQGNLLGDGTSIITVERKGDDDPITPRGDTAAGAGNLLTIYSAKGATPEVADVLGHYEDY